MSIHPGMAVMYTPLPYVDFGARMIQPMPLRTLAASYTRLSTAEMDSDSDATHDATQRRSARPVASNVRTKHCVTHTVKALRDGDDDAEVHAPTDVAFHAYLPSPKWDT